MVARTSLLVSSIALLTSFVNAYGQVAQIVDANNFCVFLPPTDSTDRLISDTEWNAQAFCHGKAPKAKDAGKLKSGFIQSAHYVKTKDYVQITGQIDPTKANLDPTDDGGQYDVKAPKGATCAGWTYFVNLIEPAGNTYCIRCCNDTTNCNRGISSKGCAHIIPGDYSGPFKGVSSAPASSTSADASSTKGSSSKATSTKKSSSKTTTEAAKATDDSSKTTTDAGATTTTDSSDDDSSPILPLPAAGSSSDADAAAAPTSDDAGSADAGLPIPSASSNPSAADAAAEIASAAAASSSPAPAAASPSGGSSVINEQSVQQQEASGAESLRPVVLTLAITAASLALIQ